MKALNKWFVTYYLVLLVALVSWTNSESLPPMPLRLIFMGAVMLPVWMKKSDFLPEIFFTFVVISASSYAVSYMPVDGLYVLITLVFSVFVFGKKKSKCIDVPISFKLLCILSLFVDILFSSGITSTLNWLSIIIVAEFFFSVKNSRQLGFLTFSFAIISLVLSLEFICVGDKFVTEVNTLDGTLDRKGWTDPNYFGAILGFGVFTSLVELIINKEIHKNIRYFYFVTIILSLYTIFGTASRGAIIALVCSSLILLFIAPLKISSRLVIIAIGGIILFIMFQLHMLDLLILRFQSDEGDAGGRTEIWIPRINAFFNECNPMQWIFGIGTDNAMKLGTNQFIGFHNDYLSVLVKYGFIGFISLLSLLISPIIYCRKHKGIVFAGIIYLGLCMCSIEPFTGGQWGCLYFYLYILVLSQTKYEK